MLSPEVWAPAGAVLVAFLAYLGGRATSDATVAGAWRDMLEPYRDEQERLWNRVTDLDRANAVLSSQLQTAREELGVLRRTQRADTLRSTAESVAVRTTLADSGITVPDVRVEPPPLERTRASDTPARDA